VSPGTDAADADVLEADVNSFIWPLLVLPGWPKEDLEILEFQQMAMYAYWVLYDLPLEKNLNHSTSDACR